jgi:hypothetical protein
LYCVTSLPAITCVPSDLPASAEKWRTIASAIDNWGKTARLCLVLFVLQVPFDGWLIWLPLQRR